MSLTRSTYVEIRTRFEASHQWRDAPAEVDFLRHPHRHEFHVRARVQVYTNDRDIEFILMKRFIDNEILSEWKGKFLGFSSCEMLAEFIANALLRKYAGDRGIEVEVSEDGENGAIVRFS